MTVSCVKVITILLAVSLLLLSGCSQGPEEANERMIVTDDLGRDIALPQGKLRAAVLLASFADGWLLAGGEIAATVHDAWEDYDLALNESAVDLGPYGIRSNVVLPGTIKTARWVSMGSKQIVNGSLTPIGDISDYEDVANAVWYLGTDLSKNVTGTELVVDGGMLAQLTPNIERELWK